MSFAMLPAASTAILIATTDQKLGNYNVAHGILFDTHQDLVAHQIGIPSELRRNLLLLHSYILAKVSDMCMTQGMPRPVQLHVQQRHVHVWYVSYQRCVCMVCTETGTKSRSRISSTYAHSCGQEYQQVPNTYVRIM